MALATQTAAQQGANTALREGIDLQRQFDAMQKGDSNSREDSESAFNEQTYLRGSGLNSRQRDREMTGSNAERAKSRDLQTYVDAGILDPDFANSLAWQAGQDARTQWDRDASTNRDNDNEAEQNSHSSRMKLLGAQNDATGRYRSNDPELQIQLQLLARRNELEAQNAQLADGEKIDVQNRLDDYEAEVRAEQALNRLTQQRQAIQSAVEGTLSLQKEHELAMAHTEAQRLAIEQRYDAILRGQRGEVVSPEESAEQAKQRAQATQNEQYDNLKNQATRIRDSIAEGMRDGGKKGLQSIWEMMQNATFTRVANLVTNGIFSGDVMGHDNDIFDVMSGKNGRKKGNQAPTLPETAISMAPSITSGLHAYRADKVADGVDTAPAMVKRSGLGRVLGALSGEHGGTGQSATIASATIHIQTATEHIQTATIYGGGTAGGGAGGGGNGSNPSWEQIMNGVGIVAN